MRLKPSSDLSVTAAALLLTLGLWACFTWPLPAVMNRAIPASHDGAEQPAVRDLVPGDHLQLLYHFTLVGDMLAGRIPWLHNVYEFNVEGDETRREPGAYYAPFSVVYALLQPLLGPAAAWNLTGLLSLLLTAWLTALLARRYGAPPAVTLLAAAVAVLWPYRWLCLMGGSPTGLAMAWVPLLALGVDTAVRRGRWTGGLWAALALLCSAWGDTHTFFFSVLSLPLWCLVAVLADLPPRGQALDRAYRAVLALIPVAVAVLAAYLFTRWSNPSMEGGGERSVAEVALFAPHAAGLLSRSASGPSAQLYTGWTMTVLLLLPLLALVPALHKRDGGASRRYLLLLLLGCLPVIVFLALGPHGPRQGTWWLGMRKLLPPYGLIRQTAKIFCLIPTLGALVVAFGWPRVMKRLGSRAAWGLVLASLALCWIEYAPFFRPALCGLPAEQPAYAAVAADAESRGQPPRALVVTLWPGDSHYSSVYLYFAQRYGIRLVNGYRPFPPAGYKEDVFLPFERINQGVADAPLLDRLLEQEIHYLLLHEDLFPEKVSPFPVGFTLQRLNACARLEPLAASGPVRAYRILPEAGPDRPSPERPLFPAWRWRADTQPRSETCGLVTVEGAERPVAHLEQEGDALYPRPVKAYAQAGLMFFLRLRGEGSLSLRMTVDDRKDRHLALDVNSRDWHWTALPVDPVYQVVNGLTEIRHAGGVVEVDRAVLARGPLPSLEPGERLDLPAEAFFHAGFSRPGGQAVELRPGTDPAAAIFYGPHWPLPAGLYDIALTFSSPAPPGTPLGRLTAGSTDLPQKHAAEVVSGQPAVLNGVPFANHLFRAQFVYNRRAPVTLQGVVLERKE